MSRKRLLSEMDSEEISHWQALYLLEYQEREKAQLEQQAVAGSQNATERAREMLRGKK